MRAELQQLRTETTRSTDTLQVVSLRTTRLRSAPMWLPAAAQSGQPQYLQRAMRFTNIVNAMGIAQQKIGSTKVDR